MFNLPDNIPALSYGTIFIELAGDITTNPYDPISMDSHPNIASFTNQYFIIFC